MSLKTILNECQFHSKFTLIFESNLNSVESYEGSYSKEYQDHVPCSFANKLACVDNKFTKPIVVFRDENAAFKFIKAILKEYEYCTKVITKM